MNFRFPYIDAEGRHEHPGIDVRFVRDGVWQLREDFTWRGVTVPKDFRTDGASIPRLFWAWIRPEGKAFPAGLIHDWRYEIRDVPRWVADVELYWNLLALEGSATTAWAMWAAVRTWGWAHWADRRKRYA
jgi:hypothetical protein